MVICDGMVIGGGEAKPTPMIAMDILGVDANTDAVPLSYASVGHADKIHNMAKIYSGHYQFGGHKVGYLLIIKVGLPSERAKPGNRGKRDSQMILMRFLNRVFYNTAMSPLELEMYRQIDRTMGIHPIMYEFMLMVDADTKVLPSALKYLVSFMVNDSLVMGLCGETKIENRWESLTTMIQVYEYFISHYLHKLFESLFGTVTCLPGCFCMWRIKSYDGREPLLCAQEILDCYSETQVDTLHMKNLLHLGEDRYLTTLMLKFFPQLKTRFTPNAACETIVPNQLSVLKSQRRRWINSTVHNLFELILLPNLCGFCCFSMRFIVIMDLTSTILLPASLATLGYLLANVIITLSIPWQSIYLIAFFLGLQIIIVASYRKFQNIFWMVLNYIAYPFFNFYLPL